MASDGDYVKSIEIFRRIILIKERIEQKGPKIKGPKELEEYLAEQGCEKCSRRTIQRDISTLKSLFGINIDFNQRKGYYELLKSEDEVPDEKFFDNIMSLVTSFESLSNSVRKRALSSKIISVEYDLGRDLNQAFLDTALKAIKNKQVLRLKYNSKKSGEQKVYFLEPYHIKEFQHRWYLIGYSQTHQEQRTFAMWRIESLAATNDYFEDTRGFSAAHYYKEVYGVYYKGGTAVTITATAKMFAIDAIKQNPIHHSQEITAETDTELHIQLHLIPNTNLIQRLLSYGSHLEVTGPAEVRNMLMAEVAKMAKTYGHNLG